MGAEAAMDSEPSPIPEIPGVDPNRRYVGVLHEFHNAAYAQDWASRFTPSPPREELFATMLMALRQHQLPTPHVLELGIGPAYFAERLLRERTELQYEGLDFSQPMLDMAAKRLQPFSQRVTLTVGDLLQGGIRFPRPRHGLANRWRQTPVSPG